MRVESWTFTRDEGCNLDLFLFPKKIWKHSAFLLQQRGRCSAAALVLSDRDIGLLGSNKQVISPGGIKHVDWPGPIRPRLKRGYPAGLSSLLPSGTAHRRAGRRHDAARHLPPPPPPPPPPFPSPIQTLNPFSASSASLRHQLAKPIVLSLSLRPAFSSAFAVAAVVDDEDVVVGDCLVFDDDAFEEPDLDLPSSAPPPRASRYGRRAEASGGGSLVPEKWRDAEEEINLTKKEKRRIAHGMRFGSRLERRAPPAVTAPDEFRAYSKGTLQAEREHVADVYRGPLERTLPPEKVEEPPLPEPGTRVAPKNPRMGMDGGSLEDIAEFFSSQEYASEETEDSKSPKSHQKLFSNEEKVLLNKRVPDLEGAASSKWPPLHTLTASGDFYLLDSLLKHNVDINALDKDGLPAIHKAILSKKAAIINYLLRNSANPFIQDKDGATLMHYAVQAACSQTIKTLLLYNVDINRPDDYGWTPLHLAVQTQRTDIVKLLLIKGADRNLKTQDGLTPLELCLRLGHHARTYELLKLLKSFPGKKQRDSVYLEGV